MNGEDWARYQLIAKATYLPKGYLVAAATYLRFAPVHQASVSASLRYQLIARATYLPKGYLTKLRFRLRLRFADSAHSRAWSR
jgi:hypothetical protein